MKTADWSSQHDAPSAADCSDYSRRLKPTENWRGEKRTGWPDRWWSDWCEAQEATRWYQSQYIQGCLEEAAIWLTLGSVSTGELDESVPVRVRNPTTLHGLLPRTKAQKGGGTPQEFVGHSSSYMRGRRVGKCARCSSAHCSGFSVDAG
jgi:hypothetical protein